MLKVRLAILSGLAMLAAACSTGIDMPKGTSRGYSSARLIQRSPKAATGDPTEREVHGMVQEAIKKQFQTRSLGYGQTNADLLVAYLVLYQEPGMTAQYDDYFGYGRDANKITDQAHQKGTVEGKRPEYFERGGILIDVIDARTNKLVYRNYAVDDVVRGASAATRAARINAAVGQALGAFFQ
jgi:hypothetical protein